MLLRGATLNEDSDEPVNIVGVEELGPAEEVTRAAPAHTIDKVAVSSAIQRSMRTGTRYSNELAKLGPHHVKIVMARVGGAKPAEIASGLGVSLYVVHHALRSGAAQALMANLLAEAAPEVLDIRKRMEMAAPLALNVLHDVMTDERAKPETRANVAFGILDRAGYGAVQKQQKEVLFKVSVEAEQRLLAAMSESNGVVDVEYELVQTPKPVVEEDV